MRTLPLAVLLSVAACSGDPGNPCAAQCTDAPPAECADDHVLRTFAPTSECADGCHYVSQERRCDIGCRDGACLGDPGLPDAATAPDAGGADPCVGVVCNTPPPKTCASTTQLRVYDPTGTCSAGACAYSASLTPCAHGCAADACVGDPCVGVVCNLPPANSCADANTLTVVNPAGTCAGGACSYGSAPTTCAFGCAAGECTGDPCAGKACNTPPASYCLDPNTLRAFSSNGACAGGGCTYAASNVTCQFGCAGGMCQQDPCAGKTCNTPPAAFCSDPGTLRTFAASGSCAGGSCTYAPSDTPCPFGCAGAACQPDPCLSKTCNTPPPATCVASATAARVYAAVGACGAGGSCSYGYVDTPCANGCSGGACNAVSCNGSVCNTPPSATCLDATRLRTFAASGTCPVTTCAYQAIDMACSAGCFNGACIAGSWTRETNPLAAGAALFNIRMAVDPAGTVHEVGCASSNYNLIYRARTDIGWKDEVIDVGLGTGCDVAIALDPSGIPAVAYTDSVNHDLRFAWRAGGTWSIKELVATTGTVGDGPSLTFDGTGRPVAACWGQNAAVEELRVATRTGVNTWASEVAVTGNSYAAYLVSDVRFDGAGKLHVAGGSYYGGPQPAVHAIKSGTWQKDAPPASSTNRRALGVGADGVMRFFSFGINGYSYVRSYPGANPVDEQVEYLTANYFPIARLDGPLPALVMGNANPSSDWKQRINGFWASAAAPFTSGYVSDFSQRPDGRARFVTNADELITAPLCVAQCSGRTCGDDACGGSCGTCAGSYCAPLGVCSAWRGESIGLPGPPIFTPLGLSVGSGNVHAFVAQDWTGTDVSVTSRTGGVWGATTALGVLSFAFRGAGVSPTGAPLFAFGNSTAGVYHLDPGGWVSTPFGSSATEPPGLEVDAAGDWHVVWTTGTKLYYAKYSGGSWTTSVVQDFTATPSRSATHATLSIDGAGFAHVAWILVPGAAHELHYSNNAGGTWSNDTVDTISDTTFWTPPQLRVDAAGNRHLVYASGYTNQTYAYRAAGAAAFTKEAFPASNLAGNLSDLRLSLDRSDVPVLVLAHGGPSYDVTLYKRTGSLMWSADAVATFGPTSAAQPVLAFDELNKPHVLFWDGGVLRYATKP